MTSDPDGEDDEELSHLVLKKQLQTPEYYSRLNKKNQEKTYLNYHKTSCSLNYLRSKKATSTPSIQDFKAFKLGIKQPNK